MGETADTIRRKLTDAFAPERLEVVDQSRLHAGHSGAKPGGETHFDLAISAAAFAGVGRVERQRMIYAALEEELAPDRVHALSIKATAPGEG